MSKLSGLFNPQNQMNLSERGKLEYKYSNSCAQLLVVVIFTAINVLFALLGGDNYLLFSAHIPYYVCVMGLLYCGKLDSSFYQEMELDGMQFLPESSMAVFAAIAFAIIGLYVLFWFLSRKRVGWLIAALVFFSFDTVFMFINYGFDLSMILDIIFHAWVLYYLIVGVRAHYKLKELPEEEIAVATEPADGIYSDSALCEQAAEEKKNDDSPVLRKADENVKSRIFLQTDILGHTVIYRRVKSTNELVIDGNVYSDYEAIMERPHELYAKTDGHTYTAGTNRASRMYIAVDGQIVVKKIRWI